MKNDKLEKLLAQRKAIDAQIQLEKNKANEQKRKDDTRRKILTGAAVLDEASKQPKFKEEIYNLLSRFLKRNDERALFELPPLPVQETEAKKEKEVNNTKAE